MIYKLQVAFLVKLLFDFFWSQSDRKLEMPSLVILSRFRPELRVSIGGGSLLIMSFLIIWAGFVQAQPNKKDCNCATKISGIR